LVQPAHKHQKWLCRRVTGSSRQQQRKQQRHQPQQQVLSVPLEDISKRLAQLNPRHLSCLLGMLVRLQPAATSTAASKQSKVFEQFIILVFAEAVHQLPYMAPRELSNILWAAAKVQQPPAAQQVKQMFKQMALDSMLAAANPQDLSMALYAVAALGVQVPELQLQAVLQAAVRQLHAAAPQAAANTIWAVAVLQYRPEEQLLQAIEQRCCNLLQQQLLQQQDGGARHHVVGDRPGCCQAAVTCAEEAAATGHQQQRPAPAAVVLCEASVASHPGVPAAVLGGVFRAAG